jgi:3-hydroxyisobutyrate dehydrogenase-like beta-hydroxyacid dehydrogenase
MCIKLTGDKMSAVTILGLGSMGSAIAKTLLNKDHSITVWNRTGSKALPLVNRGATIAGDVGEAIAASPIIVLCLASYEAARSVLNDHAERIASKTIIGLSSGTPQQAREMRAWAERHGASFLSGAIMVPPSSVGKPEALFFYDGSRVAFDEAFELLSSLGGDARYLGNDAGLALLFNTALLGLYWSTMVGFLHGAALVGSAGIRADTFASVAQDFLAVPRDIMAFCADQINAEAYPGDFGQLDMDVTPMEHLRETGQQQGVQDILPAFLLQLADIAIAKGHAKDSFVSVIEAFRGNRQTASVKACHSDLVTRRETC